MIARRRAFGLLGAALGTLAYADTAAGADEGQNGWVYTVPGTEIYAACQQDSKNDHDGNCTWFVIGVVTGASIEASANKTCLWNMTKEVNGRQLVDIVLKEMTDHPEKRHEPALILIIDAVRQAFPCK